MGHWDSKTLKGHWDSKMLMGQWDSKTLKGQWDNNTLWDGIVCTHLCSTLPIGTTILKDMKYCITIISLILYQHT